MRTTVTLDDDVARALEQIRVQEHITFRQALNEVVREGVAARERRARQGGRSREPSWRAYRAGSCWQRGTGSHAADGG